VTRATHDSGRRISTVFGHLSPTFGDPNTSSSNPRS
jgi:hypothetical protein